MWKQRLNKPVTKRFIDAFPRFEKNEDDTYDMFYETWLKSPFYIAELTKDDLQDVYNHLLADFYNWHYIYLDDMGIALNTMKIISEYYPNTKERMSLAKQIRELSLEDFKKSGVSINSQAQNPKITTEMGELVDMIDSQTAGFYIKSDEQVLLAKFNSLMDGIMDAFIEMFKPIFAKIYNGSMSYMYENEEGE